MDKPIIIQGALQSEIDYLLNIFNIKKKISIGTFCFYECSYKEYPVIICKTKIGEISSAIATSLAIKKYDPLFILNQGTAGALVKWLNKGGIVIGKQIYYLSDFSTDENKENEIINPWKKDGYRTIDGEFLSYNANKELLDWLKSLDIFSKDNIYFDIIGSGDIWTKNLDKMRCYNDKYGIVCEAMECSGAYLAANSLDVPLISIRVISNNEFNNQIYDDSIGIISQKISVDIIDKFLQEKVI